MLCLTQKRVSEQLFTCVPSSAYQVVFSVFTKTILEDNRRSCNFWPGGSLFQLKNT